ncbi:MAG: calcium/sodium antiporter [Thermoplasmata archaeon]
MLFLVGLYFLIKSSDVFIEKVSAIARHFGVSDFIIGLTLVAVGTSLPELASSIMASIQNESNIIMGNVVGSNIANIGLILGLAAVVRPILTREVILKRDGFILLFVSMLLCGFTYYFGYIGIVAGIIFLFIYLSYVLFLLHYGDCPEGKAFFTHFLKYTLTLQHISTLKSSVSRKETGKDTARNRDDNICSSSENRDKKNRAEARKEKENNTKLKEKGGEAIIKEGRLGDTKEGEEKKEKEEPLWKLFLFTAISLSVVIGSSYLLIYSAVGIAESLEIPSVIIGITMIAVGTSLPELSVSIAAARKNAGDIVIGNVMGSNIANILLILGVSGLLRPVGVDNVILYVALPMMILITVAMLLFTWTGWRIVRSEGILFFVIYAVTIGLTIYYTAT